MPGTFTINLVKPIKSVRILHGYQSSEDPSFSDSMNLTANTEQIKLMEGLKAQKKLYAEAYKTLQSIITKLNQLYDGIFAEHKKEIAELSVEIARKILTQKITDGDYEIESIVKEALKNAPTHQDLVVYLNPHDLAAYQKTQHDGADGILAGIKFVADQNIGRAECVLESPKGIIKSLINEHLEQIDKALKQVE